MYVIYQHSKDIFAGLLFLLFALIFQLQTQDLYGFSLVMPQALIVMLSLGGIYLVIKGLMHRKNQEKSADTLVFSRVAIISVLSLTYVILIPILGFFTSSVLFLIIAALIFRDREQTFNHAVLMSIIFAAILCGAVWLGFGIVLQIQTPEGIFF